MVAKHQFIDLDQKFEHFLDTVFIDVVESDLTPEKRAMRRKKADLDDLKFCKIYYPNIFNLEWNDLHRFVATLKTGMYTLSGFRKCGKSAITYISKAIKPLAKGVGGIVNINARTIEVADERTAALIRLIKRNPMLIYDYDIEIQQDLKGYYIINNTFMISGSVKTGLRNLYDDEFKRIRIAINDDLYNKDTVTSEYDNAKVVDFIESEVRGQMEDDALSVTMGNSISENCPIVQLKIRHPERHFSLPALDENGRPTWPEYRSETEWDDVRKEMPYDVWMGEFMDQPALKGDILDPDWLKSININLVQVLARISCCDPAHGVSPAACYKAIATGGMTNKHELIVDDLYIRKEGYFQLFDYVDNLRKRLSNWVTMLFENDFAQWDLAEPYYREWMQMREKTIPIIRHLASELATEHRSAAKESRLLNLVYPHQTGLIQYNNKITGSHDWQVFKSQYLALGKSKEKLDGLDALATLYIMAKRYVQTGGFKPLKKKTYGTGAISWFKKGFSR